MSYQRSALNNALSLQSITSLAEIESREDESVFIDVGSAPVMSQAVSDRRTEGKFLCRP